MIARINRLIGAILIVAASLYIVILNREHATLHLGPGYEITTSAGVIFVALFCLGILATALVATFFGFMAYMRERQFLYRERVRENFYQSMLKARSALAAGEAGKAKELWQQILRREPSNVVARIELSRALELAGDAEEALKILDAARISAPDNVEVLFRAAEAHLALNNKTAAIDNLALALYHHPSAKAAVMARDLSEELDRIDDALEYQGQVERLDPSDEAHSAASARLRLKKLLRSHEGDAASLLSELRVFTKKHPDNVAALEKLADQELALGNRDEAAQALIKAAKASKQLHYWQRAMELWIAGGKPDRALAAARTATKEVEGPSRLSAELTLIRTYIALNMFDEALSALSQIAGLAKNQGIELGLDTQRDVTLLKGVCLNAVGKHRESTDALRSLVSGEAASSAFRESPAALSSPQNPPPPRLSTP